MTQSDVLAGFIYWMFLSQLLMAGAILVLAKRIRKSEK